MGANGLPDIPRVLTMAGTPSTHARPMTVSTRSSGTHAEILRSTVLIGGSSALGVLLGIVRTKALALMLGPAGFGLLGVFMSIADLARSVAAMGISGSGVRQIAESNGSGDARRIARTITVLRRTTIALGLLGALVLVLFARQISTLTFGNDAHWGWVALLSLAVFLRLVAEGQTALIQGMRRISDLAKIGVVGGLLGTLACIPVVYFLREDGVVPALVAIAAMGTLTSWWYSRQVHTEPCAMTGNEVRREAAALLKLGVAFMASGLLTTGAAYAVRLILLRHDGLAAAGHFQAAWTLGGLYVGFILQSMGADFYPRLVGSITDDKRSNRLVNEQSEVSLVLAGPGVIGTLTCASLVIAVFYSAEFSAATEALRWVCLGMAMRVISWPMGYIIVAKNRQALFFAAELAWTVVNLTLSWLFVGWFGLTGAGIAFFGSYVFHSVMVYAIVRHLTAFHWTRANFRTGLFYIAAIGTTFCAFEWLPFPWATAFGILATAVSAFWSLRVLLTLMSPSQLPRALHRFRSDRAARSSSAHLWIDLDNSPHVPFFHPIVDELRASGHTILLTARDAFQVTDLARLHGMSCRTVGRHFGKNKLMKGVGLVIRAAQLLPFVWRDRPLLAISHGSRSQTLVARMLGIRSVVIADYEHVKHINRADCMIVPDVIPIGVARQFARQVLQYPGIKEDVYAATFVPDAALAVELGLGSADIVVTVRPPATEAHYHNAEAESLLDAVMEYLGHTDQVRIVMLPRNARQEAVVSGRWPELLASGRMIIPRKAVDGLNLVWHSDLVISGGGTMNREAAALGVPVYSIFRGNIGAVDRYLADQQRMTLLTSADEVRSRIALVKRDRHSERARPTRAALDSIVASIESLVSTTRAAQDRETDDA
jgi:PST family polysaccharide transporter